MGERIVKCFNTFTREYEEVTVSEEVGTYFVRSYWREAMSERRYYARARELDENGYTGPERAPDERLIRQEEQEQVRQAIRLLNEKDRQLIRLYYYQQLTQQQIAEMMGVSKPYVSILLKRAREELKKYIE